VPAIGPIQRRELIAYLRTLDFEAPVSGGVHQYMRGRGRKLRIPNPHTDDISRACWCVSSARVALIGKSGRRSELSGYVDANPDVAVGPNWIRAAPLAPRGAWRKAKPMINAAVWPESHEHTPTITQ